MILGSLYKMWWWFVKVSVTTFICQETSEATEVCSLRWDNLCLSIEISFWGERRHQCAVDTIYWTESWTDSMLTQLFPLIVSDCRWWIFHWACVWCLFSTQVTLIKAIYNLLTCRQLKVKHRWLLCNNWLSFHFPQLFIVPPSQRSFSKRSWRFTAMRKCFEDVLFNSKTVISQLWEDLTHLREVIFRFKAKGSASNLSSVDKNVKTQRTWSHGRSWCCAADLQNSLENVSSYQ